MKKILFIILVIFGLLGFGGVSFPQHQHGSNAGAKKQETTQAKQPKKLYRCSMHPQVVSDKPGKCPICGMELVEVVREEDIGSEDTISATTVKIKENQQELIGLTTEPVVNRPLTKTIRTVAKIAFDPELYKAEQEYIQALKIREDLKSSQSLEIIQRTEALILAAELKLKLLGISDEQIEELKKKPEADRSLLISDVLSPYVWAYAIIYEYDIGLVKIGDHIVLKAIAYPSEEFSGTIKAIDPVLNAETRSVRLRALIDNPQAKLKPNMYGDVFIHVDLGIQLALPTEAILDTGLRKIVYLEVGKGQFRAQKVEVGSEAIAIVEDKERRFFPVLKGLKENEVVVTKGNFLIDSQSQLTGGMSALWGAATEIKQEDESEIKIQHKH